MRLLEPRDGLCALALVHIHEGKPAGRADLDTMAGTDSVRCSREFSAGVEVIPFRVNGVIHDYGLLNPLSEIPAVQAALRQAGAELKRRLA